jgi:hypothetical protein
MNFRHAVLLATLACSATLSPAFAAPLTIVACTTISAPGSYVLGNNLDAAGGDCLVVATEFVTIDLNGFVMTGDGKGNGISALRGNALRGVTIRNGAIRNFNDAIFFDKSTGVTVERVQAIANSFDGVVAGDMATVRDSVAIANGNSGFRLGQRALVTGSTAQENGGAGIQADIGANIVGNNAGRNKASGISTADGANVAHNVSRNNGLHGIFVDCPSAVVGNAASNNLGQNIFLLNGSCTADHNSSL